MTHNNPPLFSKEQAIVLVVLGVAFWFVGALSVRFGSGIGMFENAGNVIAFLIGLAVSWISVIIIKKVARLSAEQMVPDVSLGLLVATFLDGIVLTWGTSLYGTDPLLVGHGAAWILRGVFAFLAVAFIEAKRMGYKMF
ncbi:hypothetical protein ESP131_10000 [Exiguobacterium sp. U13-1]|uniref:Uncharacterized protein n=1 Tax=Exiguobacterium acetylicum TaxID=41170 RepID=A0ABX8GDN4_EXIAC|nr:MULTISPECIES: hypothetical protein [Exiguobacterium]AOT00571.1 hypothetical protein ESP131_10000 [Exiguobacterium sp. U13-1]QWB31536.1 hypothetical protein KKI46_07800 [Exiguobacterium acetylicum]